MTLREDLDWLKQLLSTGVSLHEFEREFEVDLALLEDITRRETMGVNVIAVHRREVRQDIYGRDIPRTDRWVTVIDPIKFGEWLDKKRADLKTDRLLAVLTDTVLKRDNTLITWINVAEPVATGTVTVKAPWKINVT